MVGQTVYTDPKDITHQIDLFFYSNSSNSSINPDFWKFKEIQEMISLPKFTATTNQASILNEPITMSELNSIFQGKKAIVMDPIKYRSYFSRISELKVNFFSLIYIIMFGCLEQSQSHGKYLVLPLFLKKSKTNTNLQDIVLSSSYVT